MAAGRRPIGGELLVEVALGGAGVDLVEVMRRAQLAVGGGDRRGCITGARPRRLLTALDRRLHAAQRMR